MSKTNIAQKVQMLYSIMRELEQTYPNRKFTLDGHLIGSIGEVLAAEHYNLELLPTGSECHDAVSSDGKMVQIKITQTQRVALSSKPDHLLVLKLYPDGSWCEVYNGPGELPWEAAGKIQKNGQRPISLAKLRKIAASSSRSI